MDIVPKTTCTELDVQCTEMCTELDMYRSGLFGTEVVMYRKCHVPNWTEPINYVTKCHIYCSKYVT